MKILARQKFRKSNLLNQIVNDKELKLSQVNLEVKRALLNRKSLKTNKISVQ